jgi:hypothetical protein
MMCSFGVYFFFLDLLRLDLLSLTRTNSFFILSFWQPETPAAMEFPIHWACRAARIDAKGKR